MQEGHRGLTTGQRGIPSARIKHVDRIVPVVGGGHIAARRSRVRERTMTHRNCRPWCAKAMALCLIVVGGCDRTPRSTAGMSETQVRALFARLLLEQADAGSEGRSTSNHNGRGAGGLVEPSAAPRTLVTTSCLSSDGQEKVQRTASLLVALDELMADFQPPAPPPVPERPERCLSDVAARNDPARARDEQAHLRDQQQERSAAQARAREAADEVRRSRPLYYAWVRGWNAQDLVLREAVSGCWHSGGWLSAGFSGEPMNRNTCSSYHGEWRVRVADLRLTGTNAQLMQRFRSRSDLHPEAEQFCSVRQARIDEGDLELSCDGPREEQSFRVRAPAALAVSGAALADVGVGDLVRFAGHGVLWKTFERHGWAAETSHWEFWRFDGTDLSIVERSSCCAAVSGGTDAGAPADAVGEATSRTRHHRH